LGLTYGQQRPVAQKNSDRLKKTENPRDEALPFGEKPEGRKTVPGLDFFLDSTKRAPPTIHLHLYWLGTFA